MSRRDDWVRVDVQMPPEHHARIVEAAERDTVPVAVWIRLALQHAANAALGSPTRRTKARKAPARVGSGPTLHFDGEQFAVLSSERWSDGTQKLTLQRADTRKARAGASRSGKKG